MPIIKENDLIEQLPGYVLWKDINSVYLKANTNAAHLLGFKHPDELVGITDYDVCCKAAEDADLFVEADKKVQCSHKPISVLNVSTFANDQVKVLLANKSLFFDEEAEPCGVVGQYLELDSGILKNRYFLFNIYSMMKNKKNGANYYLNGEYGGIKLSTRQAQCLFYVLRGKTSKVIARILHLSNRTVEGYVDDIKVKMECKNKAELIEKAIYLGFLEIIPPGVITLPFIKSQARFV